MRPTLGILLAAGVAFAAPAARAETIILDQSSGTSYDAVGDGWFFAGTTPPLPPPDGTGDTGGNALAVALITGVLEMRAMAEFPLASLAGITAAQIQSAKVTITIDDVLGTFGPGAAFDNTASDPIAVYHYPADGTVTVGDFAPAGLTQIGIVHPGAVTDASLAVSGALSFDVDATQAVKNALTNGDAAFGVLMGTTDSPTGTSLDNLSPPGVAGGKLPVLTIETVPLAPPVLSSAEQGCQTTIAKEGAKVVSTGLKSFSSCFGLILKDFSPDSTLAPATSDKCADALAPADPSSKLGKALAKFGDKIADKCGGLTPADVGSPCDAGAASFTATTACLRASHLTAIQGVVRSQYADACTLLVSVGLEASFPGVCP